ncbi:MAG: hypothetical protein IKD76_03975 [Clostridia bacterium]|nr:hypothetical protein [Clostridia bacterium]
MKIALFGNLKVNLNGETVDVIEIKNVKSVEKRDIFDYVNMFLGELQRLYEFDY